MQVLSLSNNMPRRYVFFVQPSVRFVLVEALSFSTEYAFSRHPTVEPALNRLAPFLSDPSVMVTCSANAVWVLSSFVECVSMCAGSMQSPGGRLRIPGADVDD